jgi:hypothetical protein
MRTPSKIKKFNKALKMLSEVEVLPVFGIKRFYSRYALAHSYIGMNIDGMSQRTIRGYSAMYRLQIAYSAFDSLLEGISTLGIKTGIAMKRHMHVIENKKLIESFRENNRDIFHLCIVHCDKNTRESISDLLDGKQNNILHLAAAIRHLVAHGHMSVHGGRLNLARNVRDVVTLSDEVLRYADELFGKLADQLFEYSINRTVLKSI